VSRGSSVSTVSDHGLDGRGFDPRQRQRIFPLTSATRPAVGPTQPPVQWVPGALAPGVKRGRGVMLTTHPLLVPRLRNSRSYTCSHPNAPLWSVTGPLYLLPFYCICVAHRRRFLFLLVVMCKASACTGLKIISPASS
jgi:hypothetical protein